MGLKGELAKRITRLMKSFPDYKKREFVDKFYEKNKHLPDVDYHVTNLCREIQLKYYDPSKKKKDTEPDRA